MDFFKAKAEIEKNIWVLRQIIDAAALRLFRPARGDLSFDIFFWARWIKKTIVLWSKGKKELLENNINNGDIILLHYSDKEINANLAKIICQIKKTGKDFVTVTQLISAKAAQPKIVQEHSIRKAIRIVSLFIPSSFKQRLAMAKYRATAAKTMRLKKDYPCRLNLSLSAVCQAHCIFCPTSRGTKIEPKFMNFELAKKIVDEANSEGFGEMFKFSENGEALLNKEFNSIFSYFRSMLPRSPAILVTNAELLDEEKSRFLLEHNLGGIVVNIDGATKETYEFVKKGLDFDKVKTNVLQFIHLRKDLASAASICIQILSARNYYKNAKRPYKNLIDDTSEVIKFWRPLLGKNDSLRVIAEPWLWAEGGNEKLRGRPHICKLFERVWEECYIAASGDVYICCLDYNADVVFGNVKHQSIREIWNGKRRAEILQYLKDSQFAKIGPPCVNCL
jgi:radical SAM protein with 4Fe4S-binding SPASM domain